jgi:ankyrin repeat protein
LTYAVRNGNLKIAALLIKSGAFFNYPDSSINFPLHYACAYGWRDCANLLLKVGAQINCLNEWKHSPLMIAMLKNHKFIVKALLDVPGVDVNGTDENGRSLLSLALT